MILIKKTLADVVRRFSKIKLKKANVKVPKLRVRKEDNSKTTKDNKVSIPSIINILIKSAVENAKKERKKKIAAEEDKSYSLVKDNKEAKFNRDYDTVSKDYGNESHASYIDYGKLFSYLGKFRAQSAYENMGNHLELSDKPAESGSFALIDKETMDKGTRHVKYFAGGYDLNTLSLVPVAGMSSSEWEQFKLWMKLDPVIYRLKTSTS